MTNYLWFVLAALLEISGCYAFWMWLRLDKPAAWLLPGVLALVSFAVLLTRIDSAFAGRSYAAYGGIYIMASMLWLAMVEKTLPALSDYLGIALCLAGASIILFGPRFAAGQ